MGLTEATALVGAVTGTAALVLGILNFLRDHPKVRVQLQWDMKTNDPRLEAERLWGIVTVTNIGRRPTYVSHVSLKLPRGFAKTYFLIWEGLQGQKLGEGDAPATYMVSQDDLEQYKKHWQKVRAVVFDSAGREFRSKRVCKRPSWAT